MVQDKKKNTAPGLRIMEQWSIGIAVVAELYLVAPSRADSLNLQGCQRFSLMQGVGSGDSYVAALYEEAVVVAEFFSKQISLRLPRYSKAWLPAGSNIVVGGVCIGVEATMKYLDLDSR